MYAQTYHSRVLKSDTGPKEKKPFPWMRFIVIACIVAVATGFVFLIRAPKFQVLNVNVVGANVADPTEISQYVIDTLEGNYLWILPKSSIILAAPDQVRENVAQQYPRFKTVDVDRDSMSSLRVTVTEYPGVYLWCDSTDTCSFMDEQGTVFADAPQFSGSAYLRIYSGDRAAYPFRPLTEKQVALVTQINDRLTAIDIHPLSFAFVADRELRVAFFHNGAQVDILFDPDDNVVTALDTIYTGLRTQPFARRYHDPAQILDYIDVRFGNKLVYKFR